MGNTICPSNKDQNNDVNLETNKQITINQKDQTELTVDMEKSHQIYSNTEDIFSSKKLELKDFQPIKILGRGSFGKVILVSQKNTELLFALKVLNKTMLKNKNQKVHTLAERHILEQINDEPFVVKMHYAFQNEQRLYFVLDFCQGGELFFHLRNARKFTETRAKFYAAQLILALESLHKQDIIYRDLKPENVLLEIDGYIKITDFGLSKEGVSEQNQAFTICGTPEYVAPEIILNKGHDQAVDYWSLGTIIYEMVHGHTPFHNRDRQVMFKNIINGNLKINTSISPELQELIEKLLQTDPEKRLKQASQIKQEPFFKEINWEKLYAKKYVAPFKPKVSHGADICNFDKEFTDETIKDTVQGKVEQDNYDNFSYVPNKLN